MNEILPWKKGAAFVFFAILSVDWSQVARSDEVWTTEEYNVVYQADRNRTAVWTYGNGLGTIFIDDLAGVYTGRG